MDNILNNLLLRSDIFPNLPEVYFKYLQYIPIFLVGILTTLLITPLVGKLAKKLNIYDYPSELRKKGNNPNDNPTRHIHKEITPLIGGLAITAPLIIGVILILGINPITLPIILSWVLITVSGFLDDKYNLPAKIQLAVFILCSLIIAFSEIDLTFINNPFNGYFHLDLLTWQPVIFGIKLSLVLPGDLLIIPWLILCINAVKWVGGIDGLLDSIVLIAFIILFVLGIRNQSLTIAVITSLAAGLTIGFLYFNLPPAKIFSGAITKSAFGLILGTLALIDGAKVVTSIIILAIPIIDAIVVLVGRIITYKPKNPIELLKINDTSHLHHQLLSLGLNFKQILFVETTLAIMFGIIAISTTGASKLLALFLVIFIIAAGISIIHIINAKKNKAKRSTEEPESPESKYSY